MSALPVLLLDSRLGSTLSGGYRLDRSYLLPPHGEIVEVTVTREPTQAASRAAAEQPTWDRDGVPHVVLVELAPENWYWATTDYVDDAEAVLSQVADTMIRLAVQRMDAPAGSQPR